MPPTASLSVVIAKSASPDYTLPMSTSSHTIEPPADFEHAVSLNRSELEPHLRLMAALKLFELGKISSGKAAELAGLPRVHFLEVCSRYRVSVINYPPEELAGELRRELADARKLRS